MRALGLALLALIALGAVGCGSGGSKSSAACEPAETDNPTETRSSSVLGPDAFVKCAAEKEQLSAAELPGARIFASSGCLSCHVYLGTGSRNIGVPDLSAIGNRLTVARLERLLADPPAGMPSFSALGSARRHQLAVFLAASKGTH